MKKIVTLTGVIAFFLVLFIGNLPVSAADYPTKQITLIVPTPPGGTGDLFARAFGAVAEKLLEKPIVVVNKPGASGQTAMFAVSEAPPDGYTLSMFSFFEFCAAEWEIANGRKPLANMNDFVLLGILGASPYAITVPYSSPWKTLNDLITDAKSKPDYYALGLAGLYTSQHIGAELLMRSAGIKFRAVPYAGGGPLATALVGNHVTWGVTSPGSVIPLMQGNKVRILAVLGDKRYEPIRDVPTAKELGYDVEVSSYVGILAPPKTPMPIVTKLREVMKKASEDERFRDTILKTGEGISFIPGETVTKMFERDLGKVRTLYKQLIQENK